MVSAPSLPHVWGLNLVDLKREDLDAPQAAAVADREQSPLSHRALLVYGETIGPRLAPGLRERGYDAQRTLLMEHRGGPPEADGEAAAVSLERASPMLAAFRRTRPYADRPGVVEQLAQLDARTTRELAARDFCAPAGGTPLAGCRLFTIEDAAQIEHVGTLPEARRLGLAGAAVRAALTAAYADGLDPIFILADADDWPGAWYARLGFETVGELWEFTRGP